MVVEYFTVILSISSEFITLMRKVTKSPLVMDVINIAGVQKTLDRLADLLGKIQKALGEYLERERASFPRYGNQILCYYFEILFDVCFVLQFLLCW